MDDREAEVERRSVEVYADCRALLAEELGVEPAPETAGVFLEALAAGE